MKTNHTAAPELLDAFSLVVNRGPIEHDGSALVTVSFTPDEWQAIQAALAKATQPQ